MSLFFTEGTQTCLLASGRGIEKKVGRGKKQAASGDGRAEKRREDDDEIVTINVRP